MMLMVWEGRGIGDAWYKRPRYDIHALFVSNNLESIKAIWLLNFRICLFLMEVAAMKLKRLLGHIAHILHGIRIHFRK